MKIVQLLIGLLSGILVCLTVVADDASDLVSRLSAYETAQGEFTQTLVDAKGELIQESSGTFSVKKPGRFYWETKTPFPQILVSNLVSIWLYDPDLEQVTIRPYKQSIDQSPALLLSGNVQEITTNYSIKKSDDLPLVFTLIPKTNTGTFTELQLVFDDAIILSMLLKDSLQQTTTFIFHQLKINDPIADTLFQFEPPPGVDVLIDE
jgi:outer membrane lipoprotein carrier protein